MQAKQWKVMRYPRPFPAGYDVCDLNQAAGVLPIDRPFPSGHYAPPAHEHCACILMLSDEPPPLNGVGG